MRSNAGSNGSAWDSASSRQSWLFWRDAKKRETTVNKKMDIAAAKWRNVLKDNLGKDHDGKPVCSRPGVAHNRLAAALLQRSRDSRPGPPDGSRNPAGQPDAHRQERRQDFRGHRQRPEWDKVNFLDEQGPTANASNTRRSSPPKSATSTSISTATTPPIMCSFVCLAKTGYYDGMASTAASTARSTWTTPSPTSKPAVRAAPPRPAPAASATGCITEIGEKLTHEEGVLGACRSTRIRTPLRADFASRSPQSSTWTGTFTIFGRVTKGLDIVRTINKRAVMEFDRLRAAGLDTKRHHSHECVDDRRVSQPHS